MIIKFGARTDARGTLIAIEGGLDIPFDIQRVYYIFGTSTKAERGFHAHRMLQQLMICTSGSCTITLDNGRARRSYQLNKPTFGLFVDRMTWREMSNFSEDAVLLVLASRQYEVEDYIHDYSTFLAELKSC